MDVSAVPTKQAAKGESQTRDPGKQFSAASLIASFADALRNAGSRLENQTASLLAPVDRSAEPRETRPSERPAHRSDDHANDAATQYAKKNRSRDDKTRAHDDALARKTDTQARDAAPDDGTERAAPAKSDRHADKSKNADKHDKSDSQADASKGAATDGTQQAKESAKPAAAAQENAAPNSIPGQTADDQTAAEAGVALASQLFATKSAGPAADAGAQAAPTTTDDGKAAIAAVGGSANHGAVKAGTQGLAQNAHNGGHAATENQTPNQAAANPAANPVDVKAQQAAALSRMTGAGNTVSVTTTVTDTAAQLVSQPSAVLTASAATADAAPKPMTAPSPAAALHVQAAPTAAGAEPNPLAAQAEQMAAQAARGQVAETATPAVRPTATIGLSTAATATNALLSGGGQEAGTGGPQMPGQTTANQQASQAQNANAPRFTVPRQTVDQISVQITKALKAGVDRINIQLRPEHLGRVDVKMEVGHDGRVTAVVTADKQDTLDMLQRDARELARALQNSGFNTDSGSLSFSLREQGGNGGGNEAQYAGGPVAGDVESGDDAIAEMAPPVGFENGIGPDGRIDIRA